MKKEKFYLSIPHRDNIDPEGYHVIVKTKSDFNNLIGYFYEEQSGKIQKYLENFDELDVSIAFPKIKRGVIFCRRIDKSNKNFIFYNKKSGNVLKTSIKSLSYPCISFSDGVKYYQLPIHVIIARLYIPRVSLDSTITVDHINNDRNDYSINNLRFATVSMQNKNKRRIRRKINYVRIEINKIKFDIDESILKDFTDTEINLLSNSDLWIQSKYFNGKNIIYVHKSLGLFKTKNKIFRGSSFVDKNGRKTYYTIANSQRITSSRLIYNILIDNFFPLKKEPNGYEIDHIDSDSTNNRINNLRVTTHLENMGNKSTKRKISNIIFQITEDYKKVINVFIGSREAEKVTGFFHQRISKSCKELGNSLLSKQFRFLYEKDLFSIEEFSNLREEATRLKERYGI